MNNKKTPKIRFDGFSEDWKECKLEGIVDRVQGNDGRMNLPTLTISAEHGWLDQRERFSANIAGKEQKNYTLLVKGELSYNHGNSKLAKYGIVYELKNYEEALVPRVYHSFRPTSDSDSSFIECMFATKRPDRELAKLVTSGARMDGLLNINYQAFVGINITVPEKKEQQKIGEFFKKLDDRITLQQRQNEKLKQSKQGFLQKMFPKNGETVPEIRFDGFGGEWESKRMGNISTSYSGGTPNVKERKYYGGEIPFIRSAEINSSSTEQFITEEGLRNSSAKFITKGDILYALYGATSGEVGIAEIDGAINQAILAIKPNSDYSPFFIYQWLKKKKKAIVNTYLQGGQGNLSGSIVKDIILKVSNSIQEQQKIGEFFKQLDDLIAKNERELELLQETKKAFLQKMFV